MEGENEGYEEVNLDSMRYEKMFDRKELWKSQLCNDTVNHSRKYRWYIRIGGGEEFFSAFI